MTENLKVQAVRVGSFGYLIQDLSRRIDATMKSELQKIEVDVKLFAALMILFEEDGVNQREVSQRLNFPEYFTSRNLDGLVKAGFVERRSDPNSRRTFLIFLTEAGRAKAAELPAIVKRVNDDVLSHLNTTERQQIIGLLQKTLLIS